MLEQLYPLRLIEKNPVYAFLLGIGYSVIGIGLAVLLFPEDPAIVAVALIALMFYPTINTLMKQEEAIEGKKEEFNLFIFLKDHKYIFIIYMLFFVGVLLAFAFFALILPSLATNHIFQNQIEVRYGSATGDAIFINKIFMDILLNNITVLMITFITAFLLGEGGAFLVIWNASVWGTIFGNIARTAAGSTNQNPFIYFAIVMGVVACHTILEGFAYIASATTGGVISKAVVKEKLLSKRFNYVIVNTVISLVFALIILLLAVLVETYVLGNVDIYARINRESFCAVTGCMFPG